MKKLLTIVLSFFFSLSLFSQGTGTKTETFSKITTPLIVGGSAANSKITMQTTTGSGTASAIAWQVLSGANPRITMLHGGNLGIGTTNPTSALEVSGQIKSTLTGFAFPGIGVINDLGIYRSTSTNARIQLTSTAIQLLNSNVGIGLTNPSAKLHVAGAARITDTVYNPIHVGGSDISSSLTLQSTSGAGSSDYIRFVTGSGTEAGRWTTGGRLGIGTTNPGAVIEAVSADFPVSSWIRTTTLTSASDWSGITGIASGFSLRTKTSGDMADGFGGGILLSMQDNTSTSTLNLGVAARIYARRDGSDVRGALIFHTAGENATNATMTLRNSGNVGIGTTAPAAKLHVNGRVLADTTTSALHLGGSDVGSSLTLKSTSGAGSSDYINFVTGSGSERVRVTTDGKVGIGKTNPTTVLDVNGATKASNYTTASSSGYYDFNSSDMRIAQVTGRHMSFQTYVSSLTEKMRLTNDGNLGIGTTAPAAKLHVNGGIMLDGTDTTGVGSTSKVGTIQYFNGNFYGLKAGTPPTWVQLNN